MSKNIVDIEKRKCERSMIVKTEQYYRDDERKYGIRIENE